MHFIPNKYGELVKASGVLFQGFPSMYWKEKDGRSF
jgi:hypothetical protein